ncbi:MAG TPA: hypothetical protein VK403_12080 [Allosphingosinicella sp.]|nr:hypothetical protein [Allosphingosinicella sp.]
MSIKLIFASTAALALVAGTPAFAAKGSQNEQASAAQSAGSKSQRKICKTFENTSSRMKQQRVCLTREEWKKYDQGQQ